jgi:hypothetical protein
MQGFLNQSQCNWGDASTLRPTYECTAISSIAALKAADSRIAGNPGELYRKTAALVSTILQICRYSMPVTANSQVYGGKYSNSVDLLNQLPDSCRL